MLTLFFTIVFIAELIIALQIIVLINKLDKKVLEVNAKIDPIKPLITNSCLNVRIGVNKFLLAVNNVAIFVEKQKQAYINSILKSVLTGLLFLALSQNGKKALAAADLLVSVKDFIKNIS